MKTSQGKLAMLAFILLAAFILVMPMRVVMEDQLVLNPNALRMSPGGSYKIRCFLSSEKDGQSVRFMSSDPTIVTISNDGTVSALSAGKATISAEASGGAKAKCSVEVTGVPLSELELNVTDLHIARGQHSGLSVTYNTDASDTRLQWVSEDPSIARVDNNGRVEGIAGGRTKIAVIAPNGKRAECRVTVDVASTAVSITPYDMIVGVGAQIPLQARFLPIDSTDTVKSWVVSNEKVLTVDADGMLTAHAEGTVHVSALTECGLNAGMEVMVEAAPKDMEMNPNRATIMRGDSLDMQLLLMDREGNMSGTTHPVVWTSSDTSVATIDNNGRVTGISDGVTRITASSDGRAVSGYITVRVYVREIILEKEEVYLLREEASKPIQLRLRTLPEDADNSNITFTTNNTQVANVSEEGLVTMTGGYGTAVITVHAEGGAEARFTVNVVTELPRVETEPTAVEAAPIETEEFDAEMAEETDESFADADFSDADFSDATTDVEDPQDAGAESGEFAVDEYGEIIYDEYGEPVYA